MKEKKQYEPAELIILDFVTKDLMEDSGENPFLSDPDSFLSNTFNLI